MREASSTSLTEEGHSDRLNKSLINLARSQSPPSRRLRGASPSQCHICGEARQAECKTCGLQTCRNHLSSTADKRKICDSCYRRQALGKGEGLAKDTHKVDQVQFQLTQQTEELEQRKEKSRDIDTSTAKMAEALRKRTAECLDERARLEERLVRERDRSSKVASQVSNLKLALEDARKSQQLSSQRKAEADAQVMVHSNELKFLEGLNKDLAPQVFKLTAENKSIVHCRQFLLMGCRDCKRRFTSKFRAEIMRANLSFDNFSFVSTSSTAHPPRISVTETEKEACRCALM
jgi:small-conductance mechanosensitive channel